MTGGILVRVSVFASRPSLRRFVAFIGHAPALWLFYGESLEERLHRPNLVAIALTLALMAIVPVAAHLLWETTTVWPYVFVAWVLGHVAWGVFLAVRLGPPPG